MCITCHTRRSLSDFIENKEKYFESYKIIFQYGWYEKEKKTLAFIHEFKIEGDGRAKLINIDEWFPNGKIKSKVRWDPNRPNGWGNDLCYPTYLLTKCEDGKLSAYYPNVRWKDAQIVSPIVLLSNDKYETINFNKDVWVYKILPMWQQYVEGCKKQYYICKLSLNRKLPDDMVNEIMLYILPKKYYL